MKQYIENLWKLNISSDIKYKTYETDPEIIHGEIKTRHISNIFITHDLKSGFPNFSYLGINYNNIIKDFKRKIKKESDDIDHLVKLLRFNPNYYNLSSETKKNNWSLSFTVNRLDISFFEPTINFFSRLPRKYMVYCMLLIFLSKKANRKIGNVSCLINDAYIHEYDFRQIRKITNRKIKHSKNEFLPLEIINLEKLTA